MDKWVYKYLAICNFSILVKFSFQIGRRIAQVRNYSRTYILGIIRTMIQYKTYTTPSQMLHTSFSFLIKNNTYQYLMFSHVQMQIRWVQPLGKKFVSVEMNKYYIKIYWNKHVYYYSFCICICLLKYIWEDVPADKVLFIYYYPSTNIPFFILRVNINVIFKNVFTGSIPSLILRCVF